MTRIFLRPWVSGWPFAGAPSEKKTEQHKSEPGWGTERRQNEKGKEQAEQRGEFAETRPRDSLFNQPQQQLCILESEECRITPSPHTHTEGHTHTSTLQALNFRRGEQEGEGSDGSPHLLDLCTQAAEIPGHVGDTAVASFTRSLQVRLGFPSALSALPVSPFPFLFAQNLVTRYEI